MSTSPEVALSAEGATILSVGEHHIVRRLLQRPLALGAVVYLAIVILAAIFAPLVAPHDPNADDFAHTLSGPTWAHHKVPARASPAAARSSRTD